MKSFINKIKSNFLIFKNILALSNKKKKFLFFSENKSYQKYSLDIIEVITKKYPDEILYVSSDPNDKINNLRLQNLYIGDGFLMRFFFLIIKADFFFLTLTDLDNHFIKKTKNIKKYIYYFHAPVSTFKNYTETAFDNYDIILCNGKFHVQEIRKREELKNLPAKKLINIGYFYFDYLSEKISKVQNPNDILVAPSWNYSYKNFIDENFIQVIEILLKKKLNVIFRPHPEHYKRSNKILLEIKNKFGSENRFNFDNSHENFQSMERSKCLITDASGISIEYLLLFKRPVLYLNSKDKIHNERFDDFKELKSIDYLTKDNFGYNFSEKDFTNLDLIIDKSIKNLDGKIPLLNDFINDNFFNFGSTKKNFALIIEDQVLSNK